MARKTREEAELTRQRILDAAVEVFYESGVARPSLTEIAALIGMTRGAVYGHFRNKSDVLIALFEQVRLPWDSLANQERAATQGDSLAVLRSDLLQVLRLPTTSATSAKALNVLFYKVELAIENRALVDRIKVARQSSLEHVSGLLHRAARAGQIRTGRDVERDARFLLSSTFGAVMEWLWDPSRFDLAAQAEGFVDDLLLPLRIGGCDSSIEPGGAHE